MAEKFVPERRKLIEYLPDYMKSFREFNEITRTEDIELNKYFENLEQVLNNSFVETADEGGISRFESMLKINPRDTDTLEERRFRVLSKFGKHPPYTIRRLRKMLDTLCGSGNFDISISEYTINVKIGISAKRSFEDTEKMLKQILPMNMYLKIIQLFNTHNDIADKKYTHGELRKLTHNAIRNEVVSSD